MMKYGINGGYLDILSESEIERIHQASLALLADPGVSCESDLIWETFTKAGVKVDHERRVVYLSKEIVSDALESAPKSFILYGRDPRRDIRLEGGQVYFGMGGASEPFFWDYDLGIPRPPTKADMVNCTRLGERLENVDVVLALCSAGDVPKDEIFLHEYDAIMRNTTKPVVYTSPGRFFASKFVEMACAASGGEEAFRRRPWISAFVTPVAPLRVSPLDECLYEFAPFNIPALVRPGPMMGATSPATLASNLAQTNAESLFVIVLSQLIRPGMPVIFGAATPAMDMTTTQCTYGSPDEAVGRAMVGQLGRYYNLPSWNTAATEAKLPDSAAAAEAMFGMMLNALSGTTVTQTMGTLASGFYGSAEMLVICNEMARMIKYLLRGVQVSDDTLALDVIREVGHGGNFLTHDHTASFFRKELYFPQLFRRLTIDQWEGRGARSILEEAHEQVKDVLSTAGPAPLPEGADEELQRILAGAIREVRMSA
jgi:trimethylamine--corrinoid protein Co-methyltransferase